MKAKDLIKRLQECNPETDVLVGGDPIYFLEELPGYYDGHYNQLIQNESKFYNIDGFRATRSNKKIELVTYSIEDYIWDQDTIEQLENLNIQYDPSLDVSTIKRLKEKAEITKNKVKNFILNNIETSIDSNHESIKDIKDKINEIECNFRHGLVPYGLLYKHDKKELQKLKEELKLLINSPIKNQQ